MAWPGWEKYVKDMHTAPVKTPRSKYKAVPTEIDGHTFPSTREATRYQALKLEQQAGAISALELQPQFPLHVMNRMGVLVCIGRMIADFRYIRDGKVVIEDAKGMRLPMYLWKKQHAQIEYGIEVVEV